MSCDRQAAPTLEHGGIELPWQAGDFAGDVGLLEYPPQVGVFGVRVGDEQVVADAAVQHRRVLFQKPKPAAKFPQRDAAEVQPR